MDFRVNNANRNNRVTFGHNQGVKNAITALKKRHTPEDLQELQVQLYDIEYTPEFAKYMNSLDDKWKNFIIRITDPTGLLEGAKRAGSNMKTAQKVYDERVKAFAVLKQIFNIK